MIKKSKIINKSKTVLDCNFKTLFIMKKLLFGLIAIVMFGFFGNAQEKHGLDLKNYLPKETISFSNSTVKSENNKEFSKKYNCLVYIDYYFEKDVIKYKVATISFDSLESYNAAKVALTDAVGGCDNGYRACARGCNDKPTELGVGLCILYCMIDCSGN